MAHIIRTLADLGVPSIVVGNEVGNVSVLPTLNLLIETKLYGAVILCNPKIYRGADATDSEPPQILGNPDNCPSP